MAKQAKVFLLAGMAAAALSFTALAAGCDMPGNNDDALYELAGRWYDSGCDFAFEITQTGEGYIPRSAAHCAVSVSGNFVYFRDSHGLSLGSFHYSIKNGKLTMTLGMGDFSGMPPVSPFIKSGAIPSGGAVPVELIGRWYVKISPPASPNFEIAKSGAMTISGSPVQYNTVVSGNTVNVLEGSVLRGTFRYSFIYGEMVVTNGTDICTGLTVLSPFVKKNS